MDYIQIVGTIFGVVFGLGIGSFLGAAIWRVKNDVKISDGRSKCPSCGKQLTWYELIPLASYILQQGKCRKCGKKISSHYFITELVTAVVIGSYIYIVIDWLIQTGGGFSVVTAIYILAALVFIVTLVFLALYDLFYFEVPSVPLIVAYSAVIIMVIMEAVSWWTNFNLPFAMTTQIRKVGFSVSYSPTLLILNKLIGVMVMFAFFWILNKLTKEKGMGWGDVLFAPLVGLSLGLIPGFIGLMGSFILGAFLSSTWALVKYKKIKGVKVPYLPYLCFCTIVVFLFQPVIMESVTFYTFGL